MDGSDPTGPGKGGNTKVSQEDWLSLAEHVLVEEGVGNVKVLSLARRLEVSRSSFYWYFKSRDDLLDQLLARWKARNTQLIIHNANRPAGNICRAVMNIFECWLDPAQFDPKLDFAVREWARRSDAVRAQVDTADDARVAALKAMFERFGYEPVEAFIRARIIYFMQIGYYSLVEGEDVETRKSYLRPYLLGFTGQEPDPAEVAAHMEFINPLLEAQAAKATGS